MAWNCKVHACTAPQNLNLNIDLHVCIQLCWVQIIDFSVISQFWFMNRISKVLARCLKHFTCFESTVSIVTTHCIVQVNFHNICTRAVVMHVAPPFAISCVHVSVPEQAL